MAVKKKLPVANDSVQTRAHRHTGSHGTGQHRRFAPSKARAGHTTGCLKTGLPSGAYQIGLTDRDGDYFPLTLLLYRHSLSLSASTFIHIFHSPSPRDFLALLRSEVRAFPSSFPLPQPIKPPLLSVSAIRRSRSANRIPCPDRISRQQPPTTANDTLLHLITSFYSLQRHSRHQTPHSVCNPAEK